MLGYLVEPFIQIQNVNGTPISGAKIYVYNADTSDLSNTYNDFEGHFNTNPVITDELGNATIIADDGIEYDITVHDADDLLLFTKKHVSIDKTSASGGTTQIIPGYGITVSRVGHTFTVSVDTDLIATKDDLADKQDKLTPGDNISISDENVISVVRRRELLTTYPLRVNHSNTSVRLYIDNDYFKTKQPTSTQGGDGKLITTIYQDDNGELTAYAINQSTFKTKQDPLALGGNDKIITSITQNANGELTAATINQSTFKTKQSASSYGGTGKLITSISQNANGELTASEINQSTFKTTQTPVTLGGSDKIITSITQNANGELSATTADLGDYKTKQTTVSAGGTGKHITTLSQDTNGVITATAVDDWSIGVDLKLANNVLSIDTDSTESGSMNFVAGHSNSVTGDYSAAFGSGNTVDGDICFVAGSTHSVTGDQNFVFGRNALVSGNNNLVYGVSSSVSGTTVTGDNNIVFGDSGTGVGFNGTNLVVVGRLQYGVDNSGSGLINNSTFVGTNNYSYTLSTTASDVTGFTFIGYNNGFGQRKGRDYALTMIGQENNILGSLDSTAYSYATTMIGYQNNSWSTSALRNVTVLGSNNGVSQYGSTYHGSISDLSILGCRNKYLVDATDGQNDHYNSIILGNDNTVTAKTNYKTLAIGFDNTLTGNCTYLIGSNLTATNEGSYSTPIMKIGFGNTYLKITPTGISKVINGTETQL